MLAVSGNLNKTDFVKRFGPAHASPNSGYPESALAAILNCRFGGTHDYFGKPVEKPYIGDAERAVETEDIRRANRLLYGMAFFGWGICMAVWLCVTAIVW